MRDPIVQLKALKNDPRFGARSQEFLDAEYAKIMQAIGGEPTYEKPRYTFADYFEYYRSVYFPKVVRLGAGAVATVAIVFGGWLTTANAAQRSLPGDALYGFKLITEQAQLRLSSADRRAILHTEFAGRRLEEAVALQSQGVSASAETVKTALSAFKEEVASANEELQALRSSDSADTLSVAATVEENLNALDSVLDQAATAGSEVSVDVADALDASRETQATAVSVVVDTHEETQTETSHDELEAMFMRQFGDLEARRAFDTKRITIVHTAIIVHRDELNGVTLPTANDFAHFTAVVTGAEVTLNTALNAYTTADYRQAFALLKSIDGELREIENRLAQAEISITQALTPPAAEPLETETEAEAATSLDTTQDTMIEVPALPSEVTSDE